MLPAPTARCRETGNAARRAAWVLALVVVLDVALVATHAGEFWPFSTYPMFARAGRPWQRALVRVLDPAELAAAGSVLVSLTALPGQPLPLRAHGIPQNDLSSLVQRAESWGDAELAGLARLFGDLPCRSPLLVVRVRGALERGAVQQLVAPVALLTCAGGAVRARRLAAEGA